MNLKDEKKRLREELLSCRMKISDSERAVAEKAIASRLLSLASYRFAETVLLYYPIKGEISLIPLAEAALKAGKKVAFPLCDSENSTMTYHTVSSLSELEVGTYGILEPNGSLPIYLPSPEKHDLLVIPAVCFDKSGYRIGYGKGYYDRYLTSFGGTSVGVTFNKLLLDAVPRGRYDRRVGIIITEKGVFTPL